MEVSTIVNWVQIVLWVLGALQKTQKVPSMQRLRNARVQLLYVAAIFSVGVTALALYQHYHSEPTYLHLTIDKQELVEGKQFANEDVEIDGKHFEDCKFLNVRLIYNGRASAALTHNTFVDSVTIATTSKKISSYAELLFGMGLIASKESRVIVGQDSKQNTFILKNYPVNIPKDQVVPVAPQ